jgi:hypothetical protein
MAKVMLALFVGLLRRRPLPQDGRPPETGEFESVTPSAATASAGPTEGGGA